LKPLKKGNPYNPPRKFPHLKLTPLFGGKPFPQKKVIFPEKFLPNLVLLKVKPSTPFGRNKPWLNPLWKTFLLKEEALNFPPPKS